MEVLRVKKGLLQKITSSKFYKTLDNKIGIFNIAIVSVFSMQIVLSIALRPFKPSFLQTPYPPSKLQVDFLAMGDKQFYFRYLALQLQTAGDKIGYITSLRDHDYQRIYGWLTAADDMDMKSSLLSVLAANYYGSTPKTKDLYWVAKYLTESGIKDPETRWRSLTYAAQIAATKIKDYDMLAKSIGPLSQIKSDKVPMWAKIIGLFYLRNGLKDDSTLTEDEKKEMTCRSIAFLKQVEENIFADKDKLKELAKDNMFVSIIVARIKDVKRHAKYIPECANFKTSS